jgi:demethylmenaquinone methyltransferase/2-methoxy-6-polyprenyl-1,4-benzoquinol methylase
MNPSGAASRGTRNGDEETVRRLAGRAARDAVHAPSPADKATAIRRMFSVVAPRYDLLNHLLSLNIDRSWRRRTIDRLLERCGPDATILDSCAGTLDLARELAGRSGFHGRVVACDFTMPMLEHGRRKRPPLPIRIACADALQLPFAGHSLDGAMVGFGVRNLADIDDGIEEFARVLRPGAPLIILDFATPRRQPLRAAYLFYFRSILPRVGRWISGHGSAYTYLPESVLKFPEPDALADRLRGAGFEEVCWEPLTGGIAAIHAARLVPVS